MFTNSELLQTGISSYGFISPPDIEFNVEIRKICEGNSCRNYAATWACPPAVGTFEECKERCLQYAQGMLFCTVYSLEDCFDFEGMKKAHAEFKKICDRLYHLVKKEKDMDHFLLLSNEGCIRCGECTYPKNPCRFPHMLFPSLEGFGINVLNTAKKAGLKYNNGENTVTFFGMILF